MKKIISLYQRNYDGDRLVRDELVVGAEWVLSGKYIATRKFDGTACMIQNGKLYKRYTIKKGKSTPEDFIKEQDICDINSKNCSVGWRPIVENSPNDQYHVQAINKLLATPRTYIPYALERLRNGYYGYRSYPIQYTSQLDGTYELIGNNVQNNPEKLNKDLGNILIRHGCELRENIMYKPLTFEKIKTYFSTPPGNEIEGLVWWKITPEEFRSFPDIQPDVERVKIKRKDFFKQSNEVNHD